MSKLKCKQSVRLFIVSGTPNKYGRYPIKPFEFDELDEVFLYDELIEIKLDAVVGYLYGLGYCFSVADKFHHTDVKKHTRTNYLRRQPIAVTDTTGKTKHPPDVLGIYLVTNDSCTKFQWVVCTSVNHTTAPERP